MDENSRKTDLCWIASYPRAGNTFFRIVISNVLFGKERGTDLDRDIPECIQANSVDLSSARLVDGRGAHIAFCKTHASNPPSIEGVRETFGVYVYRHPMDVFLSCLNYLYITAQRNSRYANYFLGAIPTPVEDIARNGQIEHYFQRFLDDDGIEPFRPFAGAWCESLTNWKTASDASEGRIECVNYANLIADTEAIVAKLAARMGVAVSEEAIAAGVALTRAVTKADGKFYWRGKAGGYSEFVSEEQVKRYFEKYGQRLMDIGVHFAR